MSARSISHCLGDRGFTLVEMVLASALVCVVMGVLLQLAAAAQQAVLTQGDSADLQQRIRVAAENLQRDLIVAGASPLRPGEASLAALIPAVLPARRGERGADPEGSYSVDRISMLRVPDSAPQSWLVADMAGSGAPLPIDTSRPGCPAGGACGFAPGDRVLVFDPSGSGAYDLFTVGTAGAGLLLPVGSESVSTAYPSGSPVTAVVQHVYFLDRATRRLMTYDGWKTEAPLVDGVADLAFTYYADAPGAARPLTRAELTDGPMLGRSPRRFDGDLLRVRRIRVSITLEAGGPPGADARLRTRTVTFDITPRNLQGMR